MHTELVPLKFGCHHGTGFISRLIRWQQRTDVSHISIVDNDDWIIEAREGHGVVRNRTLTEARKNARVDVMVAMVTQEQRDVALEWAKTQLGKSYDYLSVLRFVSRRQSASKENGKWFCSELAFATAQKAGTALLKRIEPVEVSPGHFVLSPLLKLDSTNL